MTPFHPFRVCARVTASRWRLAPLLMFLLLAVSFGTTSRAVSSPSSAGPAALSSAAVGCSVAGEVRLSGRDNHSGTEIVSGQLATTTSFDGRFALDIPQGGELQVRATHPGYLSAVAEITCAASSGLHTAPIELLGGDTNGDGAVNLFDLVVFATNYGNCGGTNGFDVRADITGDGCANLFDLVVFAGAYGLSGPRDWPIAGNESGADVSFAADVLPILEAECRLCHGYGGGLDLASYSGLMAGGNSGPSVIPGNPGSSLLIQRMTREALPGMPPGGVELDPALIDVIREWIEAGAPDN